MIMLSNAMIITRFKCTTKWMSISLETFYFTTFRYCCHRTSFGPKFLMANKPQLSDACNVTTYQEQRRPLTAFIYQLKMSVLCKNLSPNMAIPQFYKIKMPTLATNAIKK